MSDTREKLEQMGFRILDAVRTELLLSMRFMAPALNSLGFKMDLATSSAGTDAAYIRFNPGFLLQVYVERPRRMNRMYMHMLIHCLFRHMFSARDREDPELWDLCCDIAAESLVGREVWLPCALSKSSNLPLLQYSSLQKPGVDLLCRQDSDLGLEFLIPSLPESRVGSRDHIISHGVYDRLRGNVAAQIPQLRIFPVSC